MSLKNFRTIDIVWQHSKMRFMKKLRVASSDDRGRILSVQVAGGQQLSSDAGLRLYWKNRDDTNGFHDFQLVNAEQNIYEIYYPRDLLKNVGEVKAWLHLTDNTGSITSEYFFVTVFEGIDLNGIEASDSMRALTDALVQINEYQANIDNILSGLEAEYANFTSGLQIQFNDAMANLTQDSEVIAGRTSTTTGESYSTIGKRLDEMEVMTVLENHKAYFEIKDGRPRLRLEEI